MNNHRATAPQVMVLCPAAVGNPVLDVVIPVYDEQVALDPCVRKLRAHLRRNIPYGSRITIADNAGVDSTLMEAQRATTPF